MSSTHDAAASVPPPPQEVINLAYADLVIASIFFVLSGWIAWKHGKAGMVCWPILNSAFAARIIADAYQIGKRDLPMVPNAVSTMTSAAVIACLSLALIGVPYECITILPMPPKRWTEKIILGVTHLVNTIGISISTYGGAPSATGEGGVVNRKLNGAGTIMMLLVLLFVSAWFWPAWKKIEKYSGVHPNAHAAKMMLIFAMPAMFFHLIRLAYIVTYAFNHLTTTLDPVMGTFVVKLVLVFGMYLMCSIFLLIAGWLGMKQTPKSQLGALNTEMEYMSPEDERSLRMQATDAEMVYPRKQYGTH